MLMTKIAQCTHTDELRKGKENQQNYKQLAEIDGKANKSRTNI